MLDTFAGLIPFLIGLAIVVLSNENQCCVCCVCIYRVRKAEWWIGVFPSSVDTQQTSHDMERRTSDQGGREVVEMKGGRETKPQTSHLPPLLPRGLQGMGTSLFSTQTPPYPPTSPSTGLGPFLPGWDPSSPTCFPDSVILLSLSLNLSLFLPFFLRFCMFVCLCTYEYEFISHFGFQLRYEMKQWNRS